MHPQRIEHWERVGSTGVGTRLGCIACVFCNPVSARSKADSSWRIRSPRPDRDGSSSLNRRRPRSHLLLASCSLCHNWRATDGSRPKRTGCGYCRAVASSNGFGIVCFHRNPSIALSRNPSFIFDCHFHASLHILFHSFVNSLLDISFWVFSSHFPLPIHRLISTPGPVPS